MSFARRFGHVLPRRPHSVWFALATGILVTLAVAAGVLGPVLALVGSTIGAVPLAPFPYAAVTITVIAGYALAAGLLALILRIRNGTLAWILAVAAVVAALIVSVYPFFPLATAATDTAGDAIPVVVDWVNRVRALLP